MPSMSKKSPSEHWEQREFVSWWRKTQPDIIFAIPNGGKRGPATAQKLRLEGVMPGVWDIFCPERYLWIEFKRRDQGTLSQAQREFGEAMLAAGYRCMVAWGCDDAIRQIQKGEREQWTRPRV